MGRGIRKYLTPCGNCSKPFTNYPSRPRKYCSKLCSGVHRRGAGNYLWKGNKATYRVQHAWIVLRLGKANHCAQCGLNKIPKGMKRYFHWANISKRYLRDTADYISLCVKCHKAFDATG